MTKEHYSFESYLDKGRWNSIWHQLAEIHKLNAKRVLEIGPGPGVFKLIAELSGLKVETLDLDPDLSPDHLGSATSLPFQDGAFDVVCAFQMLEHLPYEKALVAFSEMARVSAGPILISLPDAREVFGFSFRTQWVRNILVETLIPAPRLRAPIHVFDGEHHWELNKRKFSLKKVTADFSRYAELHDTFRVPEKPFHRFLVFNKKG
ncbi:MAG: class I SAM-dependent methyltransferase [Gammaproteobacteria bacterium]|nr:class I SAM-dependent methyltransferase [Gammaproteobacteria bacterium]